MSSFRSGCIKLTEIAQRILLDLSLGLHRACRNCKKISAKAEPDYSTANLDHQAFLNGYVPEDEGLYDDYPIQ